MGIKFEHHPHRKYCESGEHKGKPMAQALEDSPNAERTAIIYVSNKTVKLDVLDRTRTQYEKEEDIILESHEYGPSDDIKSFHAAFADFKLMRRKHQFALMNITGVAIEGLHSEFQLWEEVENADVISERDRT